MMSFLAGVVPQVRHPTCREIYTNWQSVSMPFCITMYLLAWKIRPELPVCDAEEFDLLFAVGWPRKH
jgi:hypothetical protein